MLVNCKYQQIVLLLAGSTIKNLFGIVLRSSYFAFKNTFIDQNESLD